MVVDRREVGPPPENGGKCPKCGALDRELRRAFSESEGAGRRTQVVITCTACGEVEHFSGPSR